MVNLAHSNVIWTEKKETKQFVEFKKIIIKYNIAAEL